MARHNIDIAIRAQDEASATINRMGGLLKGGLGLFAVERAAAAAARTYQLFTLNAAQSHAALAGDAKGALEKQLEINEAWKDTLRLIPGARPLVDAFFDAFGREKEIRQTIETLNLLAVATEKAKDKAVTWGNEAEIAAAKMRGNTEAEIAFIKARQEGKGRQGDIESVQADLDKNRRALAMARANLMEQQEIDRQMSEPGWDPVRKGVNALASRVPIPGINWTSTDTLKSTVSSLEATEKDLKLTISAMEKAAVTLNRGAKGEAWNKWREEARKFDEDAQRRADEAARGAAQVARAEDEKAAVIQSAQDRVFNATHDARERELHDIDRRYQEEQQKWKDHAEVMAAFQDAYHEERAAALGKFAKEDAAIQARAAEEGLADAERAKSEAERQTRAEFGGGWRAAPTLISGSLTGVGVEQQAISEARSQTRFLARVVELLQKADTRDSASTPGGVALTVQIEGG